MCAIPDSSRHADGHRLANEPYTPLTWVLAGTVDRQGARLAIPSDADAIGVTVRSNGTADVKCVVGEDGSDEEVLVDGGIRCDGNSVDGRICGCDHRGTFHADPLYSQAQSDPHDIAVVTLDKPIKSIQPAVLPKAGALSKLSSTQRFTAVGYGAYDVVNRLDTPAARTFLVGFVTLP